MAEGNRFINHNLKAGLEQKSGLEKKYGGNNTQKAAQNKGSGLEKKNNGKNYQKELEKILGNLPDCKRRLLLHSCCAPCSSYVLEYLRQYFQITVLYYNPNISKESEYKKRVREQIRFIQELNEQKEGNEILFVEGEYNPRDFYAIISENKQDTKQEEGAGYKTGDRPDKSSVVIGNALANSREGGERCFLCYRLRLGAAAELAARENYDYFATTLSISPLKNAEKLNQIGLELQVQYQVPFLVSDFKKKDGYKRSVELSLKHGLYRQDYCGCIYSKIERETEKIKREKLSKETRG